MNLKHLLYFSCCNFSSSRSFICMYFTRWKRLLTLLLPWASIYPHPATVNLSFSYLRWQVKKKRSKRKRRKCRWFPFATALLCSTLLSAALKVTLWSGSGNKQLLYKDRLLKEQRLGVGEHGRVHKRERVGKKQNHYNGSNDNLKLPNLESQNLIKYKSKEFNSAAKVLIRAEHKRRG